MICLLNLDKTHLFCYNIIKQRHLRHADTNTSFCLTQGLLFSYNKRKEWCRTQTPKTPKTPSNSTTSIRRRNSWVDIKNSSTPTFRSTPSKASLDGSFPTLWLTIKAKRDSENSQNGKQNKKNSRHPKTTISASPFNNTNMAQRATNALWAISILWHKVSSRHMEQTLLVAALTCYICTGI